MNLLPNIERNLRPCCTVFRVFPVLAVLAFSLMSGFAQPLELRLVGGDAKIYARARIPNAGLTQYKAVTLTSTQLQAGGQYLPVVASVYNSDTGGSADSRVSELNKYLAGGSFYGQHYLEIWGSDGGDSEAEVVHRLQFLIPATPDRPKGSGALVNFQSSTSRKWDFLTSIPGGGFSLIDGRPSGYIVQLAGQTYDFSLVPNQVVSRVVPVGVPFSLDMDLFLVSTNPAWLNEGRISFNLSASNDRNQSIAPMLLPSVWGLESIPLETTASSGLPVEFSVVSGPATIEGNILTPTGPGTVTVRASQPGNSSFTPAIPVQSKIEIKAGVAEVKLLRGSATVQSGGSVKQLRLGDWIDRGAVVMTGDKSYVRLTFIDQSQINIGPRSEMEIVEFGGGDSGVIDLVKGKIRASVSKDYLQQEDKTKPKMLFKTRDTSFGVRGTEFTLSYTIRNGMGTTAIQMIEGLVEAMDRTTGEVTMLRDQESMQVQAPAIVPKLVLFDRFGNRLARGARAPSFGRVIFGSYKSTRFEMGNLGIAKLADIKPVIRGLHAGDFRIIKLPATSLLPEERSPFAIRFTPKSTGTRTAILRITSSDPAYEPYEVILKGEGLAQSPDLVVEWPSGSQVSDGDTRKLGTAVVGLGSNTRTVTLRNAGVLPLINIQAALSGLNSPDFRVSKVPTSIDPGMKATFNVTFRPQGVGPRSAVMEILSNDPDQPVFKVQLSGVGGLLR